MLWFYRYNTNMILGSKLTICFVLVHYTSHSGGMMEYCEYSNEMYVLNIDTWEWRHLPIQNKDTVGVHLVTEYKYRGPGTLNSEHILRQKNVTDLRPLVSKFTSLFNNTMQNLH